MNLNDVINFFINKPGYLKWGVEKLSDFLDTKPSTITKAKKIVRENNKENALEEEDTISQSESNNDRNDLDPNSNWNPYEEFLQERDIKKEQVRSVKHWQTMKGEPRFSVVVYNDGELDYNSAKKEYVQAIGEVDTPQFDNIKPLEISSDNIAVLILTDAHIDLLPYAYNGDSVEENVQIFIQSFKLLLDKIRRDRPEKILVPFGSDFWNTNDSKNTTFNGTPQDVLIKSRDSFRIGLKCLIHCAELASEIAPVEFISIPGNHDLEKVEYAAISLSMYFRKHPNIQIDDSPNVRKYRKYGVNLLAFGHGYYEKKLMKIDRIPMVTVEEAGVDYSLTKERVFYLGDIHNQKKLNFLRENEYDGLLIRFLRQMGKVSEWAYQKGWSKAKNRAYGFIHNKTHGEIGNYNINMTNGKL